MHLIRAYCRICLVYLILKNDEGALEKAEEALRLAMTVGERMPICKELGLSFSVMALICLATRRTSRLALEVLSQ